MRWPTLMSRLWGSRPDPVVWDTHALHTDPPVCIIGDLHGRADLLEQMLARIEQHPVAHSARKIFVGDMIDRGPDSLTVLRRLHRLNLAHPDTVLCLMGNHERMMLDFLDNPTRHGPRWIAAGGAETLTSAGVPPWGRTGMQALADQLRAALGPQMIQWLTALPLFWQTGQIGVTHAGASPAYDLVHQPPARLLWGAQGRREDARTDGIWIAQGHDIVPHARFDAGRIMVDTGAWRSGLLSAVWLDGAGPTVIEIRL